MAAIVFRGTRQDLHAALAGLPALLSGRGHDSTGLILQLHLRLGMAALSLIRAAFLERARDGVDETGETWPPLSPRTIAYGRRHPGLARRRRAAAKRGSNRPSLTAAQDRRWRQLYASRGGGPKATRQQKGRAAAYAWFVLKAEGATTVLASYGTTKVEMLRDTGILFNSLSPGVPGNVLESRPGAVIVGTNVPYALAHHRGGLHLPRRRLWPDPEKWPPRWWSELLGVLLDGAVRALELRGR